MNAPHHSRHPPRRWLLLGAKLLIVALVAWGIRATLVKAFDDLGRHEWHLTPAWLVLAAACYLLGTLPSAFFWHGVLTAATQPVHRGAVVRAFLVSQVGKYVPGKAMVVVMRAALLHAPGVETTVVAASVFFETLTTMAVGSLVALVILLASGLGYGKALWLALGLFAVTGLPSVPAVFRVAARMVGLRKLNPTAAEKVASAPWQTLTIGWCGIAAGWFLMGLSLWATLRALGASRGDFWIEWPLDTAAIALSVVAGFVALIPGGLGVRELALVELVSAQGQDPAIAAVAAVLVRLVWLVSEVASSIILYLGGRRALPLPSELESMREHTNL